MDNFGQHQENFVDLFGSRDNREKLDRVLFEIKTEDNYQYKNAINAERFFKKRFGIRPTSVVWPWRNASNLHMPLVDKTMRRSKPNFANLVVNVRPTVALESNAIGDDRRTISYVERWFDQVLHDPDKMAIDIPIIWGVDLMLERGRFITKVIQEFDIKTKVEELAIKSLSREMQSFLYDLNTTDEMLAYELALQFQLDMDDEVNQRGVREAVKQFRDGKEILKFERRYNLTPYPSLYIRDPLTVLFPQDTTFYVDQARWFRDRVSLTLEDIEFRAESGMWDRGNTKLLLDRLRNEERSGGFRLINDRSEQLRLLETIREGVSQNMVRGPVIDEIYFWYTLPGSSMPQRCVLTICPDHTDLPLRMIRYQYTKPNGQPDSWPFDQVMFELVGERALSPRGYPQILDSLQTEITNNHNAKQNWMTIANSLNLKVKRGSNVTTSWIPGQPLYVNRMDDAQELNIAPRDVSFDNEERVLKQWAEEYIGLLDQTLTNQTGTPERRTKAEIDAVSALQAQVSSLDVNIFQLCMQRVYTKVWNRIIQYGADVIDVKGLDGNIIPVEKSFLTRVQSVRPIGNINSSNKQLRAGKLLSLAQGLQGSPYIDQFKLLEEALLTEDERLAENILVKPETARQNQVDRFIDDINRINSGYIVIPRPDDDDQLAIQVIDDYLQDPVKRRNFHPDRLEALKNFRDAHLLALQKKSQSTTRGGRAEQEVAKVALGERGREARE